MKKWLFLATLLLAAHSDLDAERRWSLRKCIDYAMEHNITLRRNNATIRTAEIGLTEAKAGWQPTLNVSITQGLNYRPFQKSGGNLVNGGIATQAADKLTQSGSYGINGGWAVWDGGKRKLNIKQARNELEQAHYDVQTVANTIQQEIAQLYIQILYMDEALLVQQMLLHNDSVVYERGMEMLRQGQISKADLAQLSAQVSAGRYDVTNAATQIADAKMQLRQLLELPVDSAISVLPSEADESVLLSAIPTKESIYAQAVAWRPEIKSGKMAIEQSKTAIRLARTSALPTVSLTGGLGDSHLTGSQDKFLPQLKTNFNANLGLTLSIPILDNRATRSNVERARVQQITAELELMDTERTLWNNVEACWLNTANSQSKYLAARDNVSSLQESYNLIQEQFRLGLKNIADLLDSRARLLSAQQSLLQDKYTTLLNRTLLGFYATGEMGM